MSVSTLGSQASCGRPARARGSPAATCEATRSFSFLRPRWPSAKPGEDGWACVQPSGAASGWSPRPAYLHGDHVGAGQAGLGLAEFFRQPLRPFRIQAGPRQLAEQPERRPRGRNVVQLVLNSWVLRPLGAPASLPAHTPRDHGSLSKGTEPQPRDPFLPPPVQEGRAFGPLS